jgi:peptide/nickel transport system permease protein
VSITDLAESVEQAPPAAQRPGPARGRRLPRFGAREWVGLALVAVIVLFVALVPLLPGFDPFSQHLSNALVPPFREAAHPLGTDELGRDLMSRLALGGAISLAIVLVIIVVNVILGMTFGMIAGYVGGRIDSVIMGWADVQLAMPVILVLIALSAALGPSPWLMIATLAATYWVGYARVARSTATSLRDRDFVISPRIQGATGTWTLRAHIVPHVWPQMLILASSDIGGVLLLTSSFDFLGLGIQSPMPSWGLLISEGQQYVQNAPFLALIPGAAIFLLVIGTNLISQRFTAERDLKTLRRRRRNR